MKRACADAIDELKAARKLIASQDALSGKQGELLALERQISDGLRNLRTLDEAEKQQLRNAIAAADRVIAANNAEIATLKKERMTFWKKAKYFIIGGAAGIIVGAIALKN